MAALVKYAGSRDTGSPKPPSFQLTRLGAAHALERADGSERSQDGESEADTQRAEAWRAEANVQREGLGRHEPVSEARGQPSDLPR